MIKYCNYCGNEFVPTSNNQKYCKSECLSKSRRANPDRKSYQVGYVTERRKTIKQKAVDYLGGKCKICGYNKCLAALEFHHRNPKEKERAISSLHKTWNKIKEELDKCDLLCSNCHREVHSKWIDG